MAHSTAPPSGGMSYIGPRGVKEAVLQQIQQLDAVEDIYSIGGTVIGFVAVAMLVLLILAMIRKKINKVPEKENPEQQQDETQLNEENLNEEYSPVMVIEFPPEEDFDSEAAFEYHRYQYYQELGFSHEQILQFINESKEDFEAELFAERYEYYEELGYSHEEILEFIEAWEERDRKANGEG